MNNEHISKIKNFLYTFTRKSQWIKAVLSFFGLGLRTPKYRRRGKIQR